MNHSTCAETSSAPPTAPDSTITSTPLAINARRSKFRRGAYSASNVVERRRTSGSDYRQAVFPSLPDRPRSPFGKSSDDALAWSDQSGESFRRGVLFQDFSGPIVEFGGHLVEVGTGVV